MLKKVKVEKETKEDRQKKIFATGVYKVFDRVPQGSLRSPEVNALLEKLNKA